jgi:hypothetical protein
VIFLVVPLVKLSPVATHYTEQIVLRAELRYSRVQRGSHSIQLGRMDGNSETRKRTAESNPTLPLEKRIKEIVQQRRKQLSELPDPPHADNLIYDICVDMPNDFKLSENVRVEVECVCHTNVQKFDYYVNKIVQSLPTIHTYNETNRQRASNNLAASFSRIKNFHSNTIVECENKIRKDALDWFKRHTI